MEPVPGAVQDVPVCQEVHRWHPNSDCRRTKGGATLGVLPICV